MLYCKNERNNYRSLSHKLEGGITPRSNGWSVVVTLSDHDFLNHMKQLLNVYGYSMTNLRNTV
jgi:hypothetical protein